MLTITYHHKANRVFYRLMFHSYEVSVQALGMSSLSPMHTILTENSELKLNSKMTTMHHYLLLLMRGSLLFLKGVTLGPSPLLFT